LRATPLRKRLKRFLRYYALRAAGAAVGFLPIALGRAFGRAFGSGVFSLVSAERRKALASLSVAFPDRDESWRYRTGRACFRQLGECAFELAAFRRVDRDIESYVDLPEADQAVMDRCIARGKGVVCVSAHVGNFELLARRFTLGGYSAASIAKQPGDLRMKRLVEWFRGRGHMPTIWRGEPGAAKAMLRQLRSGGLLAILIDQDTDVQGVFVDFFGRAAFTPRGAADLALHTGAAVVVAFIHRRADGGHRVTIREVVPDRTGNDETDAVALTQKLTLEIESEIRATPHEWVWMHQRWKTRPESPQGFVLPSRAAVLSRGSQFHD
jgi:Kdo2-lipid IVA lauroyltransferase/acyltransferase